MIGSQSGWIWAGKASGHSDAAWPRNTFVRFRRRFSYDNGPATLSITADSRYILFINGERIGYGPARSWPSHSAYDTYDIAPFLTAGDNVIAVLVNHYGEANFQYLAGPPGLLIQLALGDDDPVLAGDCSWKVSPDAAYRSAVPRISAPLAFEEQYDARLTEPWTQPTFDDDNWPQAIVLRPAEDGFHCIDGTRTIPPLTTGSHLPQRVVSVEAVRSVPYRFTVNVRSHIAPGDLSANPVLAHCYLVSRIWADEPCRIGIAASCIQYYTPAVKINGKTVEGGVADLATGWNSLVCRLCGSFLLPEFSIVLDGPPGLSFAMEGDDTGHAFAVAGPFALSEADLAAADTPYLGFPSDLVASPLSPGASAERGEQFWQSCDLPSLTAAGFLRSLQPSDLAAADVALQALTDIPVRTAVHVDDAGVVAAGDGWATIHPEDGADVRVLLDYGDEFVGFQEFEIVAPAGTVVDCLGFEFIQANSRYNLSEGMRNTFRYTCREGRQVYRTFVRRGFRYAYLIFRSLTSPVRFRNPIVIQSTYPQTGRGAFASSDPKLDRIWQAGARTLRCCAEDTYTDCPTYEQTHWVGDARNEALVDWAVNGDPRLWLHCLRQSGQSLDRSELVESHVPSGWQNILPSWSFLWMLSCREYLLHTGDRTAGQTLLAYVRRNIEGIRRNIDEAGLFALYAWNMFDWAGMDTPKNGEVTHLNCMAVYALRACAEMALWLGDEDTAADWTTLADSLAAAVNQHLWSDERQAYADCRRGTVLSDIFSQQTQTVAFMSGVAEGDRANRCQDLMHHPPEGFVQAGSPFFCFFLLEAFEREERAQEFLDTIRQKWGFMIDQGATTFWESWSGGADRLTRSHCHGWSAAPTYFLGRFVLGVQPLGPGFSPALIAPHPGDLTWCRGTVPTPAGDIAVQWKNDPEAPFVLRIQAPDGLPLTIKLPRAGMVTVNGKSTPAE